MKMLLLSGLVFLSMVCLNQKEGWTQDGKDYRFRWETAELQYKEEVKERKALQRKQLYTRVYFELGKEYYALEDYAAALVSFRRVIDLEQKLNQKQYTEMAKEYLAEIEKRLPRQIERQYSVNYGKDLSRLKKGIDFILAQKPPEPPPEPETTEPEEEPVEGSRQNDTPETNLKAKGTVVTAPEASSDASAEAIGQGVGMIVESGDKLDPKEEKIASLRQQVNVSQEELEKDRELMRLALQKEVLESKRQIEKLIYDQKRKQVENRAEIENRMMTMKELYARGEYDDALTEANMILTLDPTVRTAKRVKEIIETKRVRERQEKIRKANQEIWRKKVTQERAQRKKEWEEARRRKKEGAEAARRAAKLQASLEDAQDYILHEDYTKAAAALKKVLKIDPDHPEALRLKSYIELQLEGISDQLQNQ